MLTHQAVESEDGKMSALKSLVYRKKELQVQYEKSMIHIECLFLHVVHIESRRQQRACKIRLFLEIMINALRKLAQHLHRENSIRRNQR